MFQLAIKKNKTFVLILIIIALVKIVYFFEKTKILGLFIKIKDKI